MTAAPFDAEARATIRFMAESWGWTPARIADVYGCGAMDIRAALEEGIPEEDRSGTAREAPGTLEERAAGVDAGDDAGVQPADPQREETGAPADTEDENPAEADAPAPTTQGWSTDRRHRAGGVTAADRLKEALHR